jgi:hypothetical protein
MSIQPDHRRLETNPPWMVQIVFDPDGLGGDFAYTVGLFELGCPELHIYARPSIGDDPGADWKLSTRDCGRLLNELGAQLARGEIGVGSTFDREYDGGHVRVCFRIDPPGDREALEAFGVPPWIDVLPVRWSLHRAPHAPCLPMADGAEEQARRDYDAVVDEVRAWDTHPKWRLPGRPAFAADQRYGPRTPVVLARAAHLWQARPEVLAGVLEASSAALTATGTLTYPTSYALSLARTVGRAAQLDRLVEDGHELVDDLMSSPIVGSRWQRAAALALGDQGRGLRTAHRREQGSALLGGALDAIVSLLCVEAVADVADPEVLLAARGPVLWAPTLSTGVAPASSWLAGEEVCATLDALVSRLSREELAKVGLRHEQATKGFVTDGAPAYGELRARLRGWAVVTAASPPDLSLGGTRYVPDGLQQWASLVTSALTHRSRLTAEEAACLAAPFEELLPGLEAVLNQPIVKEGGD